MKLKLNHQSPIPLHAQVEELLRKLIQKPEYQSGTFLPKEVDLSKLLGVSRNTIRQATNKLEYEGLLIRKKGIGTKVTQKTVTTQLASWHSFTQEMNAQGVEFKNYLIKSEMTPATDKIAAFMGIPEGTSILKIIRLRGDEDTPFVYFESYIHPRVGLTKDEDFTQPLYELLETKFSTIVALSKEHISARNATTITAQRLKINAGDAILKRERFVYDPGNRAVEYNIGFYRADKFTYSIDITK